MGRGRTGITNQSNKKITKMHTVDGKNNYLWLTGLDETSNKPPTVALPEEFLKALGQLNPRDVANILVNS